MFTLHLDWNKYFYCFTVYCYFQEADLTIAQSVQCILQCVLRYILPLFSPNQTQKTSFLHLLGSDLHVGASSVGQTPEAVIIEPKTGCVKSEAGANLWSSPAVVGSIVW